MPTAWNYSQMRRASQHELPVLVGLMAEFYAEGGYAVDHKRAATAFAAPGMARKLK
jgi:hypothetical protein